MDNDARSDVGQDRSAIETLAEAIAGLDPAEFDDLDPSTQHRYLNQARQQLDDAGAFAFDRNYDEIKNSADGLAAAARFGRHLLGRLDETLDQGLGLESMVHQGPPRKAASPAEEDPPDPLGPTSPPDRGREGLYDLLEASTTDIAWLADTSASVVTHWRRRHDDFPEPVAAGRSPRFRLVDIIDWLDRTSRLDRVPSDLWLWRHAVQIIPPLANPKQTADLRLFVAGLVKFASGPQRDRLAAARPEPRMNERRVIMNALAWAAVQPFPDATGDPDRRRPPIDRLLPVTASLRLALTSCPSRLKILDEALDALTGYSASPHSSSEVLTDLIAELALDAKEPGRQLLDMSCGEGRILTAMFDHDPNQLIRRATGWDIDPRAAQLAELRIKWSNTAVHTSIETRDALASPTRERLFDIVCADPPTKSPKKWLQRCVDLLNSDQHSRGFICIPAAELRNGRIGRLFGMMRSTDPLPLEAVIFLPRATRRHARGLQALCVVTSKDHAPPSYLVLDLSSKRIATQPPRDDQTTTEISIHEISTALRDWREHGNESVISNPLNWAGILWSVSKIEAYDRGIYTEPWTIPPNFQAAVLELQRTMKQMKFPPSSYGAELRSLDHATSKAIIKYGLNDSSNDH